MIEPVHASAGVLDTLPCGFVSFADDGRIVGINAPLLDLLGYPAEELLGRHIERILTVGSRIFYQTHWFPLLRMQGFAEEIFMMLQTRSGEPIGALVNAARSERSGSPTYDCIVMRVRERQKYEEELLRARRTAEEATAVAEAQKQELEDANQRLEAQATELEAQAAELEIQQEQLQDQALQLEAAAEELRTMNDDLFARTQEAERMREAADDANRAKSNFLAVMSHELRTPLNAIAGYVQILEMGIHGAVNETQIELLGRVARSQRHLLRLINDVLNLARIEAGRVDYAIEEVPVAELVDGVVPMVEPQLASKGVAFVVEVPDDLHVRADREKAQQILINLLSNAVKFTSGGGRVTVAAERMLGTPPAVATHVADTGIGIPEDRLEEVFQPFVQVDPSRTRTAEGSGLGLAISRDLARGMGGDLTARSRLGEGSTFTLVLPSAS